MTTDHLDEGIKQIMDWVSISTVVTSLMGLLPSLAAVLPLVWYSIRIYETDTVQGFVKKFIKGPKDDIEP
jgi:hypothetical protein